MALFFGHTRDVMPQPGYFIDKEEGFPRMVSAQTAAFAIAIGKKAPVLQGVP